jgi:hypothetical protein
MGPLIDVAPGGESQPLARELAELVRANVARNPGKRAEFDRLRGAVAIVADDRPTALTLRFDFGRLVIHAGLVGVPDVTIRGSTPALETLGNLRRKRILGLTVGFADDAMGNGVPRRLKIYGLLTHPLLVRGLLTVLSR